ncbi:MAG: methyltransferase domain-containing protein [Candidatus Aureabacteria bacterium]|nr:methyltransferase domain-containing protein [Candidatus Auribacterota bacterium]
MRDREGIVVRASALREYMVGALRALLRIKSPSRGEGEAILIAPLSLDAAGGSLSMPRTVPFLKGKCASLVRRFARRLIRLDRETIAALYVRGDGIEIGALHAPLRVPSAARVRYVDKRTVEELRAHYPELHDREFSRVDSIDDGELLATIPEGSQDFVIANHFLEHCQDPLRALGNMVRVLKGGGVLFLGLPDKRYGIDAARPVTPLTHLQRDYREGPAWSRRQHVEEWVRLVERVGDESEVARTVSRRIAEEYSIHYHVWTQREILELLAAAKGMLDIEFVLIARHEREVIAVAEKGRGAR